MVEKTEAFVPQDKSLCLKCKITRSAGLYSLFFGYKNSYALLQKPILLHKSRVHIKVVDSVSGFIFHDLNCNFHAFFSHLCLHCELVSGSAHRAVIQ